MGEPVQHDADFEKMALCRYAREQNEEIQKHKWYESERAGRDVGYVFARVDWNLRHRGAWMRGRALQNSDACGNSL